MKLLLFIIFNFTTLNTYMEENIKDEKRNFFIVSDEDYTLALEFYSSDSNYNFSYIKESHTETNII